MNLLIIGDVLDPGSLDAAVPGHDAVLSTLGIGNYLWTVRISRADVAYFMLRQLNDDAYLRKSPSISN